MYRFTLLVCFVGLAFVWNSGCDSGLKRPPIVQIKGTVNLDGKPMTQGEIRFEVAGEPGHELQVKDGAFSGEANIGKNRVEVKMYKEGPPLSTDPEKKPTKINVIPAQYNSQTKLSAEITSSGASDLKFDVTSK